MNIQDNLLIEKLKEGDKAVFRFIFESNYGMLCRFAGQLLHDNCQAEEVVDDVMLHLWEQRNELTVTTSLRAYFMQAVKNKCIDVLRSTHSRHEYSFTSVTPEDNLDFLDAVFADEAHPMGLLIRKELEGQLMDAVGRLPSECKAVFEKSRLEQKTYEEIAKELNISLNTVKYHIKNALAFLRKVLSAYLKIIFFFFFLEN